MQILIFIRNIFPKTRINTQIVNVHAFLFFVIQLNRLLFFFYLNKYYLNVSQCEILSQILYNRESEFLEK